MATFGNPIVASPNLLPSMAEIFNANKSGGYGAGEYVYQEGKLYKFTAAHTGAWTGTDVEAVKLADEVSDVAAELSSFEENVGENYARVDGYYEGLTAGLSENLVATVGVDDNVPYNFRTTGGSADVGDRKEMTVIGGTVAWNQLTHDTEASNTKSGDIVTIDDAKAVPFESLKVMFQPIQDLHGYDSPWPAGGGANKWGDLKMAEDINSAIPAYSTIDTTNKTVSIESSGAITSVVLFSGIFKENTQYTFIASGTFDSADRFNFKFAYTDDTTSATFLNGANVSDAGKTVSAVIAWQYTGISYLKYEECGLFEGNVPASDFTPYENLCPISGWTGADVEQRGRNLTPIMSDPTQPDLGMQTAGAGSVALQYDSSEAAYYTTTSRKTNFTAPVAGKYTISLVAKRREGGSGTYAILGNGNVFPPLATSYTDEFTRYSRTVTLSKGGKVELVFYTTILIKEFQIELSETASDYVPYNGRSISSTIGQTVYSGTLDVISGVVTIDYEIAVFDGSNDEDWRKVEGQSYNGFYYQNGVPTDFDQTKTPMCNLLKWSNPPQSTMFYLPNERISYSTSAYQFNIKTDAFSTLDEFKAFIAENPLQICAPLITPTTIQLTPQEITALLGTNNVWNDIGTTELTYKSDNEHHTLTDGHKYITSINGTDSFVAGTGQEVMAQCGRDNVFDLTQMFGSAIATYLSGISASNAVAWFRNLFPKPLYAYDGGTLQSVQTSANITTGFNQWDEEWENGFYNLSTGAAQNTDLTYIRSKSADPIPVKPETTYYLANKSGTGYARICFYDASDSFISSYSMTSASGQFTTPASAAFMRFYIQSTYGSTYKHDICINLSWDGERDGEYEPYIARTYPLDSDLVLRGIPKLDSDNSLYYDGDIYENDGTVTRRFAVVTYDGSDDETWGYLASETPSTFYSAISNSGNNPASISNYLDRKTTFVAVTGFSYIIHSNQIRLSDMGGACAATTSTAAVAKLRAYLAVHPVTVVYEMPTPTTEEADPYADFMVVNDFGTEEFVDAGVTADPPTRDVAIPVGHETTYAANLRAKLEMAPDSPDGDGDYIVRQSNGENAYVLLEKELPAAPTTDGAYILKVTVADGTATYSWVSAT